jgi:hypothetical protein
MPQKIAKIAERIPALSRLTELLLSDSTPSNRLNTDTDSDKFDIDILHARPLSESGRAAPSPDRSEPAGNPYTTAGFRRRYR